MFLIFSNSAHIFSRNGCSLILITLNHKQRKTSHNVLNLFSHHRGLMGYKGPNPTLDWVDYSVFIILVFSQVLTYYQDPKWRDLKTKDFVINYGEGHKSSARQNLGVKIIYYNTCATSNFVDLTISQKKKLFWKWTSVYALSFLSSQFGYFFRYMIWNI